ncbi:GPP34 family phosphoprotein [Nocardioides zeae]|uniref:GPP34 family phosphoprotein n=1 Tax=Nocardioides imazamoxiresistens TaxID=3231893 RepID=A0ABU3PYL9_9ACTN|nr:GPP34 family phosphoprotein [Nocardioides zeae]MDT9594229.1 GPP34 family phosphoprotein [Nocardioides zeae]
MDADPLLVEDLMLLLLDDAGSYIAGAGHLHYTLGGAMLVDLAQRGRIEVEDDRPALNGPKVAAVGRQPPSDPLLADAWTKVAAKPQRVQSLLLAIGNGLHAGVTDRLVERGWVRRQRKRFLGLVPYTTLPATAGKAGADDREAEIRARIVAVLEQGAEPDARTAALVALLSASATLPMLRPPLPWSSAVAARAKELEQGSWGVEAVGTAVMRAAAAIAAASAASIAVAVTSTN